MQFKRSYSVLSYQLASNRITYNIKLAYKSRLQTNENTLNRPNVDVTEVPICSFKSQILILQWFLFWHL